MPNRPSIPVAVLVTIAIALLADRVWLGVQNENAHVRIMTLEGQVNSLEMRVRDLEMGKR